MVERVGQAVSGRDQQSRDARAQSVDEALHLVRGDERWDMRDVVQLAEYLRTGAVPEYPAAYVSADAATGILPPLPEVPGDELDAAAGIPQLRDPTRP